MEWNRIESYQHMLSLNIYSQWMACYTCCILAKMMNPDNPFPTQYNFKLELYNISKSIEWVSNVVEFGVKIEKDAAGP